MKGPMRFGMSISANGGERLAVIFRRHLSATHGIRPLLFARGPNRRPIRVHDLRATFVTLALASGRSDAHSAHRDHSVRAIVISAGA